MSIFRARAYGPRFGSKALARTRLIVTTSLIGAASVLAPGIARAQSQPTNGIVEIGGATIDQSSPTNTIVDLMDTNSVINWDTFDIGAGTAVNYITADNVAAYSVLNRVVTAVPSVIDGDLNSQSNISVWLVNPSGIMFGAAGTFTGGSLVLSTAAVDSTDFLDGDGSYSLTNADTAGTINLVSGAGQISASGGMVAVAQDVTSGKTVTAASGEVALIAAQDVTLGFTPGSPIAITVGAGTTIGSAKILANGTVNAQSIKLAGAASSGLVGTLLSVDPGASLTATAAGGRVFIGNQTDAASSIAVSAGTVLETGASVGGSVSASGPAGTVAVRNLGTVDVAGAVAANDGGFIALNGTGNTNSLTTTGTLSAGGSGVTPAIGIAADGAVSVAQLDATNGDAVVASQTGSVGLGTATTGGNLAVTASSGAATISGAIDAGANYSVTALGISLGGASVVEQKAKGDIILSADAQGIGTAGGAAALTLTSNSDLDDAAGGGTTSITTANGGAIDLAANSTLRSVSTATLVSGVAINSAAAAQFGAVSADSLSVTATSVTANGNIAVSNPLSIASAGLTDLNDVTITGVGAGAIVTSGGAFSAGQFSANGTAQITGASVALDTASSTTGSLELTSTSGDVMVGTANAMASVIVDAAANAIVTGSVTAGANYEIDAANITLGTTGSPTLQQAGSNVDFQLTAGAGTISGLGSLQLVSNSGGTTGGQTLIGTANGNVDFTADTQLVSTNTGAPLSGVLITNGTGNITLGAITADVLTTSATSASIAALGAVSTINSLNLTSTGSISLTSASTTGAGSNIDIAAGGALDATSLSAANQITVDASTLTVGSISAIADAVDVATSNGSFNAGTISAGTTATLAKTGGAGDLIVTGAVNAGLAPASVGTITITSDASARLGAGTATSGVFSTSGGVSISAANDITGTDAGGGVFNRLWASTGPASDLSITSSGNGLAKLGKVTAQNNLTVLAGQIDATSGERIEAVGGNLNLTATTGNLAIDDSRAQGVVVLTANAGGVTVGTATSTAQSVSVTATTGAASIGATSAATDLIYTGQSVMLSGTQTAGGKVDVTATASAISAAAATLIRSNNDSTGAEAIILDATGGNIALGNATLQAGDAADPSRVGIRLGAGANDITLGDVSALALVSVAADHVTFDTALSGVGGTVNLGNVSTVNTLDIAAVGAISAGMLNVTGAAQNLTLNATGASSAIALGGAAMATGAVQIGAGAGATATSISGASVDIVATTGNVSLATATATAGNGQLRALAGSVGANTLTVTGGDANIVAGVDIAGQAPGTRANIVANGAGRDASFTASGSASIDAISAGRNVTGTAASINANDATATDGALMLEATSASLSLLRGSAGTTANLTTSAIADLTIGETLVAGTAAGSTGDITLSSGQDILVAAFDPLAPTAGFVRSLTGSITASAGRDIRATGAGMRPADRGFGTISAGGSLSMSGTGDIRADQLTSVGNLDVSMVVGSLTGAGPSGSTTGTVVPGGAFFAQSPGQNIVATSGAAGLIQVREARAANDVSLNAGGISAGTIETTTGSVLLNNASGGLADSGEIYVGLLTSAGNVALSLAGSPAAIATTASGFAFDPAFGQANLSSATGAVMVTVGQAAQLGTVTSGGAIDVSAAATSVTTANAPGAINLTATSGGLYLGTATAGTTATLVKQGTPAIDANDGIRVVTSLQSAGTASITSSTFAQLNAVTSIDDALVATADGDLTLNSGSSGSGSTLTTMTGDIVVTTGLTAATDAILNSGSDVRANMISATAGALTILATGEVTGLAAPSAIASGLRVSSLADSGATMISASTGDIRIGSVTNTGGTVGVTAAQGSVTGLATSGDLAAGAGATLTATAGSIAVTAGGRAALGTTSSGTSTSVIAAQISSQSATAATALVLSASDALSVDSGTALGATLSTSAGTASAIDLTDANSSANTLSDGFGAANLTASGNGASVAVTAGQGAQLGIVAADTDTTVSAAASAVSSITATNGGLSVNATSGGLYLGTGAAATTAMLVKTDADSNGLADPNRDELRVRIALNSGASSTIDSATDARVANATAATGGLTLTATRDATGLAAPSAIASGLRVSSLADSGATMISASTGDIRIGSVTNTGGTVGVTAAQGSVTGLATSGDLAAGAGATLTATAGSIAVTAGGRAALGTTSSGTSTSVIAAQISSQSATAATALVLSASDALSVDSGTALGATLSTSAGAASVIDLTDANSSANTLSDGFGAANLTASGNGASVAVTAGQGAQLGTVIAHTDATVTAAAAAVSNAIATNGALSITANTGGLYFGTGSAGATATLTKLGGPATDAGDGLRVTGSLQSAGDVTIASGTFAQLNTVTSTGGNIAVTVGTDLTGIGPASAIDDTLRVKQLTDTGSTVISAATGDVRIGTLAANGGVTVSSALGSVAGLSAADRPAGAGAALMAAGAINLTANSGRAALGTISGVDIVLSADRASIASATATGALTVSANSALSIETASAAGATLTTMAGLATVVPLTSAGLVIDASTGQADISATSGPVMVNAAQLAQLGTVTAGGAIGVTGAAVSLANANAAGALNLTATSSGLYLDTATSGGTATLTKQGSPAVDGNDELRVTTRLTSAGNATLTSSTSARLNEVVSTGGNIAVTVGTDLTGLGAASAIDDTLRVNQLTDAAATLVSAATGDIRIGTITNGGSGIGVAATQGSVTGLSTADLAAGPGATLTAAGSITTTGTAGRTALGSISGTNITVSAQRASIADATATGTLTATAANALSVETANATGASLTTTAGGSAMVPLTSAGLIIDGSSGLANLTATAGSISVTAAKIAQLGAVNAGVGIDVAAAAAAVSNAVATTGALNLTATTGGLTLGTGVAGTDARLIKRNGVSANADDEIDIVTSLTTGANSRIDSDTRVRATAITSAGSIAMRASNGDVVAGSLSAGEDVAIKASNDAALGLVGAGDDVHLSIGRNLVINTVASTGTGPDARRIDLDDASLSFVAAPADRSNILAKIGGDAVFAMSANASASLGVDVGGNLLAAGAAALVAGEDLALRAGGTLAIADARAGDDIDLNGTGAVTLTRGETLGTGADNRRVSFGAGLPAFAAADVLGRSNIVVAGAGDVSIDTAISSASVAVKAGGALTAASITAGEDAAFGSIGNVMLQAVAAGDDIEIATDGTVTLVSGAAQGSGSDTRRVNFSGAEPSLANSETATGRNVIVDARGAVTFGNGPTAATPAIRAASSIAVLSGGRIDVSNVAAGEDIAMDAAGQIAIGIATSGDDIVLASEAGLLVRDTATASGSGPNARSIAFARTANGLANGGIDFTGSDTSGAGSAQLTTSGPASDIEIGTGLEARGNVTLSSSRDARLNSVRSTNGSVMANVARDLTGLTAAAAFGQGTGLRIGTLADAGTTSVAAATGDIRIGSIANTGGDIGVSAAQGSVTGLANADTAAGGGAAIAAPVGSISLLVGGRTALSSGNAGTALTVGAGTISIGSAVAGTTLSLTATGDALSLDAGMAGAGASLQTQGGASAAIGLTDAAATRDILSDQFGSANLAASGTARSVAVTVSNPLKAAQLGTVSASRNVSVVAGAIAAGTVSAGAGSPGGLISLTAANGGLYLGSGSAGSTITLIKNDGDADGLLLAQVDRDELRVRQSLVAGGNVSIVSATSNRLAGGSPTARIESTAGAVSVSSVAQTTGIGAGASNSSDPAHGRADLIAAAAGQDVSVTTGNLSQLGTVNAGRNVTIAAGNTTLRAGAPVNGAIDATSVTANTGSIALSTRATAPVAGAVEDGDIVIQSARAGTTAVISNAMTGGTAGDVVVGQGLTAAGNIAITSVGNARLAGDDSARRIMSTAGSIVVAANRSVTGVAGTGAGVTEAGFGRANLIAEAAGQDVVVTSGAVTQAMTISAGRTVDIRAGSTTLGNGAIDIVTANAASGSLLLLAQATNPGADTVRDGDINLGSVTSGTTTTITNTAGLGVTGTDLSPMLAGNAGDIIVTGGIAAGQQVTVNAANSATLGGTVSQTGNVFIQSNQIALNGAVVAGGSASEVRLVNRVDTGTTRVNATVLGNGGAANQFVLDNAELGRLGANRVVIETAQQASDIQDVTIGSEGITLTANAGRNRFEVLATSPNPTSGPNPTIFLNGTLDGGTVVRTIQIGGSGGAFGASEVTAPLVASGGLSGRIVAVLTRTGGGRILAPAANVELRAQRVLFGSEALRAAVIGLAPAQIATDFVANPNSLLFDSLDAFDATEASQTFLRADRLTVRYRDFALFQNTAPRGVNAGIAIGDGTGTGTRLSLFSTGAFPSDNAFAFFGTINNLTGRSVGLQSDMVIQFAEPGGSPQRINQNQSRLNGCVLGSPDKGCLTTESPAPALKLFDERQLLLLSAGVVTPLEFDPLVSGNNESLFVDFGAFAVDPSGDDECDPGQGEACPKPEGSR